MEFIGILIVIGVLALFVFIEIKLGNLRSRAKQQILRNSGISSSDLDKTFTEGIEKKYLEKFLKEHPNYTEESIKNLIKGYAEQMIQKDTSGEFCQKLVEKIQKDSKLEKMQGMQFVRANVQYYANSMLSMRVVYSDNRDEYNFSMTYNVIDDEFKLERYEISKGAILGF